jgi:excisionase family DNA binding protein
MNDDDDWIPTSQAAVILGISRERVVQLIRADLLQATRSGRNRRLRRSQVEVTATLGRRAGTREDDSASSHDVAMVGNGGYVDS